MTQLWELTELIRSKNAGPWQLTFDIMFGHREHFEVFRTSPLVDPSYFAEKYHVPENEVRVFVYEPALAIKVTIPRPQSAGAPSDTDVFGGQFHSPLVVLEIPIGASGGQTMSDVGECGDV